MNAKPAHDAKIQKVTESRILPFILVTMIPLLQIWAMGMNTAGSEQKAKSCDVPEWLTCGFNNMPSDNLSFGTEIHKLDYFSLN